MLTYIDGPYKLSNLPSQRRKSQTRLPQDTLQELVPQSIGPTLDYSQCFKSHYQLALPFVYLMR